MTKQNERYRCEGTVFHDPGFFERRCIYDAKVCRDGKWYCGVHDPVAKEERAEARRKRQRKKSKDWLND